MSLHHDETKVVGRRRLAKNDSDCDDLSDPFDLKRRFCDTYRLDFASALREIQAGRKRSCWSWYIFPVAPYIVGGQEMGSGTNARYALRDKPPHTTRGDDAARAFLRFEANDQYLRAHYMEMMTAVAEQVEGGISGVALVGTLDDPKLRSSLRLFERVTRDGFDDEVNQVCLRALEGPRRTSGLTIRHACDVL